MNVVEVADLSIVYPAARRKAAPVIGLDSVSISLAAGETLGIVGESGSGKSTLGRAIAGLERIDKGSVRVAGYDVEKFQGHVPRTFWGDVQMVWQDPLASLTPTMKMGDILAEAYRRGKHRTAQEVTARQEELMEMVQLPKACLGRYAHELSGGQRQRIAIARAFAADPSVVVLDEAVSALDVLTQGQILQLLREIQQDVGVSYVFISHDLGAVGAIADRTAVLFQGHLMEFGRTEQIVPEPEHPYSCELLLSTLAVEPRTEEQAGTKKRTPPFGHVTPEPGLCPYVSRCLFAQPECATVPAPVTELAPGHTSKCHLAKARQL